MDVLKQETALFILFTMSYSVAVLTSHHMYRVCQHYGLSPFDYDGLIAILPCLYQIPNLN